MHSVHFICNDSNYIGEKSKTQVEASERWLGTCGVWQPCSLCSQILGHVV